MIIKLLTEHHLEFLRLKGVCTGSSESTHVKMPHCWKSHAMAHFQVFHIPVVHQNNTFLSTSITETLQNEPRHEISNNLTF